MLRSGTSLCTTPGSTTWLGELTTAPTARSRPTALASAPPGSSRDRSGAGGRDLARPWPYHQGMPFCTKATGVSGPSNGPMTVGQHMLARRLHGHQHGVLRPEIGRPVGGLHRRHDLLVAGEQREAARADRFEMCAARHDGNLVAGRRQSRREIAADGARAEYANPHAPLSDPAVGWSAERGGNNHGHQR